ncbi:MAG: GMC family oxidoreductase N-terminal domain-containing protein [Hyphomicrobiales bacterium]
MTFDYIIVGAGSAGCVLANRLSENGKHKVLLLEAGGSDRRFFVQMPLGYGKTFYDKSLNWLYAAAPDPGLNGQRDHWPRGRILGGSSSINAMVYIRGHAEDYEGWKAAGNPGWGWNDVLAAYKAMENVETGEAQWHGRGGPLHVSDPSRLVHPLTWDYIKACEAIGLKHNLDFNGAEQEGTGIYQVTIKNGIRNSAARAFLRPAMKRPNLKVETGAFVTKLLMDGRKVLGVAYDRNGQRVEARAKEVILSGGAINSPQLLQLSGIGPAPLLKSLGIPVLLHNANVGSNLEDHVGINYTYRARVPTLNDELRPWWGKLKVGLQYLLLRSGPLSTSINHGGGFFRTSTRHTRPNMQLYFQAFSTLKPAHGERPILSPDPFSGLSVGLSNCRPTSRGTIMIESADAKRHPVITPNAFSTENDVEEMLAAVKFVRRIANAEPLKSEIVEELRPGPAVQSDADLIHDFKQRSGTVYHPSCTCRMGPDASSSVVDAKLRVHGIDGLRVCDASVFPNLIAGNTNAPAMMVGWKGAELILAEQ